MRDFEQRENNNNEFYNAKRDYYTPERNFSQEEQPRREMRGDEQRGRDYSYDRGREVSQYITEKYNEGRNFVENDTGSERNYRKSVGDASVSLILSFLVFFLVLTTLCAVQYQFSLLNSFDLYKGKRVLLDYCCVTHALGYLRNLICVCVLVYVEVVVRKLTMKYFQRSECRVCAFVSV